MSKQKMRDGTTKPYEGGDKVIYIPNDLLMGDKEKMEKNENLGVVHSKNDEYVFVTFIGESEAKAINPQHLYFLHARPDLQKIIDEKIPNQAG